MALVMPRYEAVRLDDLPHATQRTTLPRLLPALWDALAASPHGDLQPGNVLVEPNGSAFHLIDPCTVVRRSELRGSPDSRQELLFTTSPYYYPLLPPYHAARISLAEGHDLASHLQDFLRGLSMASRPFSAGEHTTGVAFQARGTGIGLKVYSREPHPPDLQALGVLYYTLLTGRHPFFDVGFPGPDWLGGRVEDDRAVGFDAALDRVTRPVVRPSAFAAGVSAAEERLVLALLLLSVPSRDALVEWARDVEGAA